MYPSMDHASTPAPVVAGWLDQVTEPSVHAAARRSASTLLPALPESAYSRSLADSRTHPAGAAPTAGNRTSDRVSFAGICAATCSSASEPLLASGPFSSTHASATAVVVTVLGAHVSPWAYATGCEDAAVPARTARTRVRARRCGLMS